MRRTLTILTLSICSLFLLGGCADAKSMGMGPWPIYEEPKPLALSEDEKAAVMAFIVKNPALWKRIQNQDNAWRAIVRTHNKNARTMNKKQLATMGFDEQEIKATLQEPTQ